MLQVRAIMLHRDDGVEPKRVETSSAGSALAAGESGCVSASTIRASPGDLDFSVRSILAPTWGAPATAAGTSLSMVRLSDLGSDAEVVSLDPYMRCGPVMGISSLFF